MANCPASYICFGCKMVGDHWIMQCPKKKQRSSKPLNDSHSIMVQHSTINNTDPCTMTTNKKHDIYNYNDEYFDDYKQEENDEISNVSLPAISGGLKPANHDYDGLIYMNKIFEREIETFYNKTRPLQIYINEQDKLFKFISECICIYNDKYNSLMIRWDIFKFGGNVWNLDTKHSDIDIAIDLNENNVSRVKKQNVLYEILCVIKRRRYKLIVHDITNARYPIITIKDKQNDIKMDLSISDKHCKNTTEFVLNLLNLYTQKYGIPIRKLIVFIKYWTKQCGINNAMKYYLNSFGYTLMAIKYIQCILFCNKFIIENKQNLTVLVYGFFDFYGFWFKYNKHSISICIEDNNYNKYLFGKKKTKYILEIIDPVNKSNNVAKNVGDRENFNIISEFQRAYQIFGHFINNNHTKNNLSLFQTLTQSI